LQAETVDVKLGAGLEFVGGSVIVVVGVVVVVAAAADAAAARSNNGLVADGVFGGGGAFRVGRMTSLSPGVADNACSVCRSCIDLSASNTGAAAASACVCKLSSMAMTELCSGMTLDVLTEEISRNVRP
jgi:hypothetical protein